MFSKHTWQSVTCFPKAEVLLPTKNLSLFNKNRRKSNRSFLWYHCEAYCFRQSDHLLPLWKKKEQIISIVSSSLPCGPVSSRNQFIGARHNGEIKENLLKVFEGQLQQSPNSGISLTVLQTFDDQAFPLGRFCTVLGSVDSYGCTILLVIIARPAGEDTCQNKAGSRTEPSIWAWKTRKRGTIA